MSRRRQKVVREERLDSQEGPTTRMSIANLRVEKVCGNAGKVQQVAVG